MTKINIKPLSVNQCWQGRRFKTKLYKQYESDVLFMLPKIEIPKGELCVKLYLGLSNKLNDIDNSIKPFLDILQKKYGFNDKDIYQLHVYKLIVPKGNEFIQFEICENTHEFI
jgi:Holliday junction resolvase RusA-like endonuclease